MFAAWLHRRQRAAASALLATLWVVALAGCDAAWDGPGLLAQAEVMGGGPRSDTVEPEGDAGGPRSDGGARPDVGAPEQDGAGPADVVAPDPDVAFEDVPEPADVPQPEDVPGDTGPDVDVDSPLCQPPVGGTVNPLLNYALSATADREGGIDLDRNDWTCSPREACSDGVDNTLSSLAGLLREDLLAALVSAVTPVLPTIQPLAADVRAGRFPIALWPAESIAGTACGESDLQCEVVLYAEGRDGSCGPAWYLQDGEIVAGPDGEDVLVAGRFDSEHILELTVDDDLPPLEVSVYALQIRADVVLDGGHIVRMDGVIGGAMERLDISDLLPLIADEVGSAMPFIEFLLEETLDSDIDLDGDGRGDAMSFAVKFTARDGQALFVETDGLPLSMDQH